MLNADALHATGVNTDDASAGDANVGALSRDAVRTGAAARAISRSSGIA
ncbi:MAG TPA: hypothetical protein VL424_13625 [Pararobbsia sp.]|nr:hypothetical protein [Pararobbsia sp.]